MKSLLVAAAFAALSLTVPALAESADSATCQSLNKEASAAISGASGDVSEARREQRMGLDACRAGLWENGVSHYRKALSLVGK